MKSYLSLAWKELKTQKVTSALILIAVILSTVATTALGQSIGILQTMRSDQAAGLNGDRYATFHQLTEEQNQALHSDPRLTDVGSWIYLGSAPLGNSGLNLYLREYHEHALDAYPTINKIIEGTLPAGEGEIALSEETLRYLGIEAKPGDTLTLPVSVSLKTDSQPPHEYRADFLLTGILENNYIGYASGTLDGIAGTGTAAKLLPERYFLYSADLKTKSKTDFQSVVNDLAQKLNVAEYDIQYNETLLDALGISYEAKSGMDAGSGFPFMMAACILAGVLILLAAGLVIYNILKVAVSKRIREYGTLRAIGSERKQLYMLVTVQLLILCGIGLPLGVVLGSISAKGILTAALGFLNPDLFMAGDLQELNSMVSESGTGGPLPLLASIFVTLLFAVLAAYPSARYASRISPTVAMSGQSVKIRRKHRRQKKIRNFEAFYARLNLKRNPGRTVITILSIVMSITVFVALQSFGGLLDASRNLQGMYTGDYSITNETAGISPEAAAHLSAHEMVETLSASKLTVYSQDEQGLPDLDFTLLPSETFQIASVDRERLLDMASGLPDKDLEDLLEGKACLVKNPIQFNVEGQEVDWTEFQQNDRITVNGTPLRIAGIIDGAVTAGGVFLNGVQIITAEELYGSLVGNDRFCALYPALAEDADIDSFEKWLDQWCKENPGTHWLSYRDTFAQLEDSFEQIRLLCWGLILFIGLIGILNIVNTVYTNIHTRVNEIGMQRAIGMSTQSLYKTFLWEGAYYGMTASVIGGICGYVCTIFINAADTDALQLTAVPWAAILEAAVVSAAVCLAATAIPLYGIGKMSIVDSIETVE